MYSSECLCYCEECLWVNVQVPCPYIVNIIMPCPSAIILVYSGSLMRCGYPSAVREWIS